MLCRVVSTSGFKGLLKLYAYPLFFVITGSLVVALSFQVSDPLFQLNGVSIGITPENQAMALAIVSRSLALMSIAFFFFLSHSVSEISEVMRKMKMPALLIELFILSYKYIVGLMASGKSILTAQHCRLAYSGPGNKTYAFSLLISMVFRRAMEQTNQLETSINSRLGDGIFCFVRPEKMLRKKQFIVPVSLNLFLAAMFLIFEYYG